ncbi:hypothetical protein DCS_05711 [Drechmeria coniospora]|uniref:Uncharacterized protein n=1 Tax=Drechmeria coniospora TaxID=98403 RepID=A0A151GNJ5_DRECN|nr:hypothetical protein DCS_05711 [Drechmeria coniospora]KYK58694.1 hypothetical protein DCS_05711 [Drechmeria coniospora]
MCVFPRLQSRSGNDSGDKARIPTTLVSTTALAATWTPPIEARLTLGKAGRRSRRSGDGGDEELMAAVPADQALAANAMPAISAYTRSRRLDASPYTMPAPSTAQSVVMVSELTPDATCTCKSSTAPTHPAHACVHVFRA